MLTDTNCKWLFRGVVIVCLTAVIVTALVTKTPVGELMDYLKVYATTLIGG